MQSGSHLTNSTRDRYDNTGTPVRGEIKVAMAMDTES